MWFLWSHLRMGPCLAGQGLLVPPSPLLPSLLEETKVLLLYLSHLPSLFCSSPSLSIFFFPFYYFPPLYSINISYRAELLWDQGWTGHWRLQWRLQHPQKTEVYLTLSLPKPLALFFFLFPSLPSPLLPVSSSLFSSCFLFSFYFIW